MPTVSILLPWRTPPLSLNDRGHHMARARTTAEVRRTVHVLACAHRLPTGLDHVTVQLHYRPARNGRRDPVNLIGTQKALVDGLTAGTARHPGYGLVPDDTPNHVTDTIPIIHPAEPGEPGQLWLTLTWEQQ